MSDSQQQTQGEMMGMSGEWGVGGGKKDIYPSLSPPYWRVVTLDVGLLSRLLIIMYAVLSSPLHLGHSISPHYHSNRALRC